MSILAIDTATQVSSVAIAQPGRLQAEITLQARLTHSETLMPHIQQVLDMADTKAVDLEGIAISIGPGSFTGLRIGLATAKAMCYALDKPLVTVSTLAALACHLPLPGICLLPLIDAQKGNAYYARYRWENGGLVAEDEVSVGATADIVAGCAAEKRPVILLGDVTQRRIAGRMELPDNVTIAPAHELMPRAACVAMLGLRELAQGHTANVMDAAPIYIRRSEAEVLWEKRHPESASTQEAHAVLVPTEGKS